MGIRAEAEADLAYTLEDAVSGFGFAVELIAPDGAVYPLNGQQNDISAILDPDTGTAVRARDISVTLRASSLPAGRPPIGIPDETASPWLVRYTEISGDVFTGRVAETLPDDGMGLLTLKLEPYRP